MENNKKIVEPKIEHKLVETYAEDMARVIQNDHDGLVRKIIHEQEEHDAQKKELSPQSKKNQVFMIISGMLLFSALSILVFFLFKNDTSTVTIKTVFTSLVFVDNSYFNEISGFSRDQIIQSIINEANSTAVKKGGIEGVYLVEDKKIIGLRRFLSLIKSNVSLPSDSSLVSDNFLVGVLNKDSKNFFIMIKARSIADIFDSLHSWENKMFSDLSQFFGVNIASSNSYLLTKSFDDSFIKNKNARILYDKDGNIILMYVFADDNTVIITNKANVVEELIFRLTSSKIKR